MANISQINGLLINAATASLATTASFLLGSVTSASFASTASFATTASYASTASYSNTLGAELFSPAVGALHLRNSAGTSISTLANFYATSASAAITASFATSASRAISSSFALTAQTLLGSVSTASYVVNTVTGTNSADLVYGNMADNDQFRIRVGGTATNAGFVEIATADDGTEPIHVRQYSGVFSSLVRTATLLDGSGNSSFPGGITATSFTGSLRGTASYATQALSASYATQALSASYAPGGGAAFPFTGSARITGSLNIIGTTTITGSLLISGSISQLSVFRNFDTGSTVGPGGSAATASLSFAIPANTFKPRDVIRIKARIAKTATGGNTTVTIFHNYTNTILGANNLGIFTGNATLMQLERTYNLLPQGGVSLSCDLESAGVGTSLSTDNTATNRLTTTTDFFLSSFLIIAISNTNATDTARVTMVTIERV